MRKYSDLMYAIYELYASESTDKRHESQIDFADFDALIEDLPFAKLDAITSARNALCAKYEEAAFLDGFRTGAGLILELLQS